jgi:surfactin synthase thioesterase subunit
VEPRLWLPNLGRSSPQLYLICFAHAGGGTVPFFPWGRALPEGVGLIPVRRPGREGARAELPLRDIGLLAAETVRALAHLPARPFVLLGHSVGGLIAYEVARLLQCGGTPPELLIVSGRAAPQIGDGHAPIAELDDTLFIAELDRRYGGIPREFLDNPDLLTLMLPALRADIAASESYRHTPGLPLRCPLMVCYGSSDRAVDPQRLQGWADLGERGVEFAVFPGGHFFPYEPASGFLPALRLRLSTLLA